MTVTQSRPTRALQATLLLAIAQAPSSRSRPGHTLHRPSCHISACSRRASISNVTVPQRADRTRHSIQTMRAPPTQSKEKYCPIILQMRSRIESGMRRRAAAAPTTAATQQGKARNCSPPIETLNDRHIVFVCAACDAVGLQTVNVVA
ncbi:hypothetical protein K456DRAFT_1507084 [Colletotrichum gloeosporioides 23]|nr:hypothetical protein K456DRAFT_1507084 [Colletotrichum gloeosporioides 23]